MVHVTALAGVTTPSPKSPSSRSVTLTLAASTPILFARVLSCFLLLTASLVAAACPVNGPVTSDASDATGCADLQLLVAADNVTIDIEAATGTINITSDFAGTTLRFADCVVTGNQQKRSTSRRVDHTPSLTSAARRSLAPTSSPSAALATARSRWPTRR